MNSSHAVAIVGMSCSFPGSPDIESFWQTIRDGHVHFRDVPHDRWDHSFFYSTNRRDPDMTYAKKIACLDDLRSFAPERYGIPPRRAYLMDPQQRLFLDQARLALDDAGHGARPLPRSTGVYVGASVSEYKDLVASRIRVRQIRSGKWGDASGLSAAIADAAVRDVATTQQYSMVGVLLNMIACNVSDAFDLHGPALVMDAACSSSLIAMHEAVLHLRHRICDAAIVGGVYSICIPDMMVAFSKIGALSRNDRCRPFDNEADGFVLGEGAGAIVLKRLEDALRDGDRIWAVIRGVGLNNDGGDKGAMIPSLDGQVDVLDRAYRDAGVSPDTIGYVEAHGTATRVGDLTEISALRQNAKVNGRGAIECGVASAKGNIGHTLAASGIAAIIKAVLVLNHRMIPPQAGLRSPREGLDMDGSGFYLPTSLRSFEGKHGLPRRVGVSSFGFGGTNVHAILEEPAQPIRQSIGTHFANSDMPQLFVISAATPYLLAQYLGTLANAIERTTASLYDLAYTLTARRRLEDERIAFVASSRKELLGKLVNALSRLGENASNEIVHRAKSRRKISPNVLFIFAERAKYDPQYFRRLYDRFSGFRSSIDTLSNTLIRILKKPLSSYLTSSINNMNPTQVSVLVAAIQVALKEFVSSLGLQPRAMIGIGTEEKVATASSGTLDSAAALHLVMEMTRNAPPNDFAYANLFGADNGTTILKTDGEKQQATSHTSKIFQAADTNVLLHIGRDGDFSRAASDSIDTDRQVHLLNLIESDEDSASGFLKTIGRLVTIGLPIHLDLLYESAKPVSLPSAPLATRTFWAADSKRHSEIYSGHAEDNGDD